MTIKLEHSFLKNCVDLKELLADCNKLSTYCNKLEKQAILFPNRYNPDTYKGDGFEFFTEALIKLNPVSTVIGIGNYSPISKDVQDVGVDGFGVGLNNKPATVQVKYRSDHTKLLKANEDHLSNFVMSSILQYQVDKEGVNNMLIVTTAADLLPFTKETMFANKVRCIGWEKLRLLVDNNLLFWSEFQKLCNI